MVMDSPNILVIVLDSVRARNMSLHGYHHQTTPFLESLAQEAVWYQYAYAPSTTSISSHTSIFTGLHEDEHRMYSTNYSIAEGASFWSDLRDTHGYRTGLFTVNPQFYKPIGLRQGFDYQMLDAVDLPHPEATDPLQFSTPEWFPLSDIYYQGGRSILTRTPIRTVRNGIARYRSSSQAVSKHLLRSFLDWSASIQGGWAAFINLMDAHCPYTPKAEYNRWADDKLISIQQDMGGGHFLATIDSLKQGVWWHPSAFEHLYNGGIYQSDNMVQYVVERLKQRGDFDETLLIITSDHGECFGEVDKLHSNHHLFSHCIGVHEAQTHVPLLVSPPGDYSKQSIKHPVTLTQTRDVVEQTVTNEFDPRGFAQDDGRVLVSRGDTNERHRINDSFSRCDGDVLPSRVYAGYEQVNDKLLKYARSGDNRAVIRIFNPQESVRTTSNSKEVMSWFPGVSTGSDIKTESTNHNSMNTAHTRLKKLGYIE